MKQDINPKLIEAVAKVIAKSLDGHEEAWPDLMDTAEDAVRKVWEFEPR